MRCLGRRDLREGRGDRRAREGNTVPLMEALLQHLLMYLLLLLLQMGNASCGKELLATSALPSHLPPESAALPCSATAANTPGKKLPQRGKKKGCPFVKWAQHVFSFSANPCAQLQARHCSALPQPWVQQEPCAQDSIRGT